MSTEQATAMDVAELAGQLGRAMARPGATARDVAELVSDVVSDDGAPLGLHARPARAGVDEVAVTRRWDSEEPDTADIALDPGLPLADLEAEFGAARSIPRAPSGRRNIVLGADGGDWTVLATLDDGDLVRSLTVRRDT